MTPAVALAPLLAHNCPCRGRVSEEFTDTDGAYVVTFQCGAQAVATGGRWVMDPAGQPRINPDERTSQ